MKLAVFYPHPHHFPLWQTAGAVLLLVCICVLVIRIARKYPYIAVGLLWYLITLLPVIGLIQVGDQALADRYTYIPMTGILIIVALGVPELVAGWQYRKVFLILCTAAVLSALVVRTNSQLSCWRSSLTSVKTR